MQTREASLPGAENPTSRLAHSRRPDCQALLSVDRSGAALHEVEHT